MALPRLRYAHQAEHHPHWRPRLLRHWRQAHARAARQWHRYEASPWLYGAWHTDALCVHSYEAAWDEPGGIGPSVSGGMQIGDSEWAHFGGTAYAPRAYQATPAEQLHVAYRYWQVSRWYPWPSTAAMCGLL